LQENSHKRYATAEALAEDLRLFQAGEPIKARPISAAERTYRWCRRRPREAALLALTLSLALALMATVLLYIARLRQDVEDERQQLVQRAVTIGMRSFEDGEAFTGLLWFTEALQLDQGDVERENNHRTRIAAALQQCPRLTRLLVPEERVRGARLSEAGSWMVTASQDRVHVWDVMTEQLAGPELQVDTDVLHATISADGRFLAATCADNTLRIWNRTTDNPYPRSLQGAPVSKVAFAAEGRVLLTRRTDFVVQRWDLTTWQTLPLEGQPQGKLCYSTFSEDGKWIFLVDANRAGQVCDAATGKTLLDSLPLKQDMIDAALSPDGHRVALVDRDNQVRIWELSTGRLVCGPLAHPGAAIHVAFSPQGDRLLTTADDMVRIWQVETGQPLFPALRHDGGVRQARFSPDGRLVISGASDNKACVWEIATGQPLTAPVEHQGSLVYAAFSPDSEHILTIGKDNAARLWELPRTAQNPERDARSGELLDSALRANPGDRQLTDLENRNAVQVVDAATQMPVGPPLRHRSRIEHAEFSPDGRFVLTASDDNTAQVWDAVSGAPLTGPCRHKGTVGYAAFSPDGRRLITASEDHTARVWDALTGEPLTPPLKHRCAVVRAAFDRDGSQALTRGADQTVHTWILTPDDRPVSVLVSLAQLLSGSRVDQKHGILPLDGKTLRATWQRLRSDKSIPMQPPIR
jgi:WD40 repeat protein